MHLKPMKENQTHEGKKHRMKKTKNEAALAGVKHGRRVMTDRIFWVKKKMGGGGIGSVATGKRATPIFK